MSYPWRHSPSHCGRLDSLAEQTAQCLDLPRRLAAVLNLIRTDKEKLTRNISKPKSLHRRSSSGNSHQQRAETHDKQQHLSSAGAWRRSGNEKSVLPLLPINFYICPQRLIAVVDKSETLFLVIPRLASLRGNHTFSIPGSRDKTQQPGLAEPVKQNTNAHVHGSEMVGKRRK